MNRRAVIDVGSHGVKLLVAERTRQGWTTLLKDVVVTRLGDGVDRAGRLGEEPMNRTLDGISQLQQKAFSLRPEGMDIYATSAMRDAVNREEFCGRLQARTGLKLEILSGEQEAELAYRGALDDQDGGVLDLGGGSLEVIVGQKGKLVLQKSLQLGAVRAQDALDLPDRPGDEGITKIQSWVRNTLDRQLPNLAEQNIDVWTAVGGTAASIASMDQGLAVYDSKKIQGCLISLRRMEEWARRLAAMDLEERRHVRGLMPQRARAIVPGIVILASFMRYSETNVLRISDRGSMEGYLLGKIKC
ncbi:Ppx/GppA phosphatase family protein [Gehongia tenuis]|uniref:Ppx/GppA phosphatase N-terminal domain-containing protein n=1 Tax=Gehongia tenuis TaxID=2763655 RepID=A0A926D2X0_9FIRM|nr:hypothetical protein [Gehongia tenuis]MBC8531415.1 hypothetical protein [Gehongia tenuis]